MDELLGAFARILRHVFFELIAIPIGHALVVVGAMILLRVSFGRVKIDNASRLQRGFAAFCGAAFLLGLALILVEVIREAELATHF